MNDLKNLKKAFISLDKDNSGKIAYDVKKISDSILLFYIIVNKYDLPVEDDNGKVIIDFQQFMQIMTENIITNRKKFGQEATQYESGILLYIIYRNFYCYLSHLSF